MTERLQTLWAWGGLAVGLAALSFGWLASEALKSYFLAQDANAWDVQSVRVLTPVIARDEEFLVEFRIMRYSKDACIAVGGQHVVFDSEGRLRKPTGGWPVGWNATYDEEFHVIYTLKMPPDMPAGPFEYHEQVRYVCRWGVEIEERTPVVTGILADD